MHEDQLQKKAELRPISHLFISHPSHLKVLHSLMQGASFNSTFLPQYSSHNTASRYPYAECIASRNLFFANAATTQSVEPIVLFFGSARHGIYISFQAPLAKPNFRTDNFVVALAVPISVLKRLNADNLGNLWILGEKFGKELKHQVAPP